MDPRLATIREKLDRLRQADPQRRVHGASPGFGHDYVEAPPLSAEQLRAFEAEHRVTLPEELRAFLRVVHSGGPGPGYGMRLYGTPAKLERAFPFTRADFDALIERRRAERWAFLNDPEPADDESDDDYPPGNGFLQLSHQGCGVFDVLIVTGELRGSVWAYDNVWFPCTYGATLPSFLDWYETWLDQNLRPSELARLYPPPDDRSR
jgi:hypothetical protein